MPESVNPREPFKHNLAVEVLRRSGSLQLSAFGNSMLPTLWPGDRLTIRARSLDQVQPGDVVLFAREGRFFIHRVLRTVDKSERTCLVTRGDAMPDADSPVAAEELLGKVVSLAGPGGRELAVPGCSPWRRWIGLALAYSGRVRSLALRWHARRARGCSPKAEAVTQRVSAG